MRQKRPYNVMFPKHVNLIEKAFFLEYIHEIYIWNKLTWKKDKKKEWIISALYSNKLQ